MLVDTTVWIDWQRAKTTDATRRLNGLLEEGEAALAPVILQGAASPSALLILHDGRGFERIAEVEPKLNSLRA